MFCQLFSLQNKSFLCLQHVENKGFQTVIKHRLKAIQKPIKNELGNREKNTKNAHFVLKKCTFRFRDYIEEVLRLDAEKRRQTSQLVGECASRTLAILRNSDIEAGTEDAFRGYVACLRQMYLYGAAVQLNRLGYHMTLMG